MDKKTVFISGKKFKIFGNKNDTYFSDYLKKDQPFYDVPIAFIEKYCPEDGVVLDLGANLGAVFCSASVVAPKGQVYAYEASKKIHAYAEKALKENKIKNVKLYNIALSDKNGTLSFFEDDNFLAGSRVAKDKASSTSTVNAYPLDHLVQDLKLDKIDIIKIDVEGHEEAVLKGAKKTLAKYKPLCLIEFNSYAMIALHRQLPQDFLAKLMDIFPRVFVFDRDKGGLEEITHKPEEFIRNNLLNGCVDDLVCTYGDLPNAGHWFNKNS